MQILFKRKIVEFDWQGISPQQYLSGVTQGSSHFPPHIFRRKTPLFHSFRDGIKDGNNCSLGIQGKRNKLSWAGAAVVKV